MPQFRRFPPFQDPNARDLAGTQATDDAAGSAGFQAPPLTAGSTSPFEPIPLPGTGPLRQTQGLASPLNFSGPLTTTDQYATVQIAPTTDRHQVLPVTTDRLAVTPLSRPEQTGTLAQRASTEGLIESAPQPTTTGNLADLLAALQSTMETSRRMVVIPAESRKERARKSTRRLSTRQRHGIIMTVLLTVVVITLVTLSPLAGGNGVPILGGLRQWIQNQQNAWQISAHQQGAAATNPISVNTGNLPPMTLPNSPYVALAQQDAIDAGIPAVYFVRQINVESGFNPNAVSPAGAVGIAQFLPSTAAGLGIDPWNPVEALQGAARLMASYTRSYGGDYAKALAAYNAGSGGLQAAINACGSAWLNCVPAETRNYIYRIMGI